MVADTADPPGLPALAVKLVAVLLAWLQPKSSAQSGERPRRSSLRECTDPGMGVSVTCDGSRTHFWSECPPGLPALTAQLVFLVQRNSGRFPNRIGWVICMSPVVHPSLTGGTPQSLPQVESSRTVREATQPSRTLRTAEDPHFRTEALRDGLRQAHGPRSSEGFCSALPGVEIGGAGH